MKKILHYAVVSLAALSVVPPAYSAVVWSFVTGAFAPGAQGTTANGFTNVLDFNNCASSGANPACTGVSGSNYLIGGPSPNVAAQPASSISGTAFAAALAGGFADIAFGALGQNNVSAFQFDWGSYGPGDYLTVNYVDSTGTAQSTTIRPGVTFNSNGLFTLSGDAGERITGFRAGEDANTNTFEFDNVSVKNIVSAAPEPATWAMMIGGLGLVGFMLRRRRAHDGVSISARLGFSGAVNR